MGWKREPEEVHDDEVRELAQPCADCGAPVSGAADPALEFGLQQLLCWRCAERRGERYDAPQKRWSVAPDVVDLRRRLGGDA